VNIAATVIAAWAGLAAGWLAVGHQHLLYQQAEFRRSPLGSKRRLVFRSVAAVATGAAWALAFRPDHYDASPAALTAAFALVLIVLASTDFERKLIPNRLIYPAMVAAAGFAWAWPDRSFAAVWGGAGFAVAVAAGVFALGMVVGLLLRVKDTPFGLGDVKLIVLVALVCGWPAVMTALLMGAIAAGVPSFALLLAGRARTTFSYGPYLAAGGVIVLLFPGSFV